MMPGAPVAVSAILVLSMQVAAANPQSATEAPPRTTSTARTAQAYYLFVLGRGAEADGDVTKAIELCRQAAEADPSSGEVRAELAAVYARQNQPREAIAMAESALQVAPDTT